MSLMSFLEEFMPTAADSAEAKAAPVTHSLRKWKGLRKVSLHGGTVEGQPAVVFADGRLNIDASTCALCQANKDQETHEILCHACPLSKVLGVPCDEVSDDDDGVSPYEAFADGGDPEPMIALLHKALDAGFE